MIFLITAGPTREPIDPARYLSNRSSGKMGYAIAQAAAQKGHRVILVSGPTTLDIPDQTDFIPIETAQEMEIAVNGWLDKADIIIMSAAVSDFRVESYSSQKIKKKPHENSLQLNLIKNPDILANIRQKFNFTGFLVGFAAETEHLLENAREKLERKKCDLILANDVSQPGQGFDSDHNTLIAITKTNTHPLGTHSKEHLGKLIINLCEEHLAQATKNKPTA